jgi:ferredoxin-type protein NapH
MSPKQLGLIGVAIVVSFYLLVGGRVYCSWVCPVNVVTDAAGWLRNRLGIKGSVHLSRQTRYWVLGMTLVGSALTGVVLWELINPMSMLHRGLIFGLGMAWSVVIVAVFLFDLFVMSRGWCGRLCPVGAFYGLLGQWSPVRVAAPQRRACNDCMDCFEVCPEPQVIRPALKGEEKWPGASHSVGRLHQLRPLHRCLFEGCLYLRPCVSTIPHLLCRFPAAQSESK